MSKLKSRLLKNNDYNPENPLPNKEWENFCQQYIELGYEGVTQRRARRILAYRTAYEVSQDVPDAFVNQRAQKLLDNDDVESRLFHLIDSENTGVESKALWSKLDSEEALVSIINSETSKKADVIKAIQALSELRGYAPDEEEEEEVEDTLTRFIKSKLSASNNH